MKKILNLLLTFIVVVTLTACNNLKTKSPIEVLEEVKNNVKEVNPVEVSVALDATIIQDGMEVNLPIKLSIKQNIIDAKNYKAVLHLSDNPFIGTQTFYVNKTEDKSVVYMSSKIISSIIGIEDDNNFWIVQPIEESEDSLPNFSEQQIEKIDLKKILTEEDFVLIEEGNKINKYRLNVTKDLLVRFQDALELENKESFDDFTGTLMVDVHIDMQNKRITKVSFDIGSFIQNMEIEETEEFSKEMIKKILIELEINYDNIEVNIPENVIKNAITAETYGSYLAGLIQ